MNKKVLISCTLILILGFCLLVFGGSSQVVTLTILHLNDNESQLLNAGKGFEDFGGAARVVDHSVDAAPYSHQLLWRGG